MRKVSAMLVSALLAASSFAGMDDRDFSFSVVGVQTGTVTYVLRGLLEGIYVDVAAATTQNVSVVTDEQILYSNATVTADAWLPLRYPMKDSAGVSLINSTNNVYDRAPLAGSVRTVVKGGADTPAAQTNATTVTLIYSVDK